MNYLKKIISTGAVRTTPARIIDSITNEIKCHEHLTILEAGAGQGEITKQVLQRNADVHYFAFEIDTDFCQKLKSAFPQINILQNDAMKFEDIKTLPASFDYFVSSIPLSFYKRKEIEMFCTAVRQHLKLDGKLIILFTAFWLIPILKKNLPSVKIEPFVTLPPYFLAVFKKH